MTISAFMQYSQMCDISEDMMVNDQLRKSSLNSITWILGAGNGTYFISISAEIIQLIDRKLICPLPSKVISLFHVTVN